jgi:hypothetical protein
MSVFTHRYPKPNWDRSVLALVAMSRQSQNQRLIYPQIALVDGVVQKICSAAELRQLRESGSRVVQI